MSSVDNRIVKMQMDNGQFSNAANSTMNTLRKLSESLKLSEGAKGLENIASKAKNVNMQQLADSVEAVRVKFSALDVIGVTALANIANSAVNAGINLAKSITIDPIMQGFNEYETKMNSITTIMTNTAHAGTTMDQVTATLDELNTYADKTIYSFADMTKNIGTFTAAGVGLQDSADAIKGIANLAAGSGSNAAQASTAMYQLSQALASGTVNLQDWNSVVNAGMGGKYFQDALKATGKEMGAVIDDSQTFRESISAKDGTGWLTADILLATLKKFSNDPALMQAATQVKTFTQLIDTMKESVQSGWAKTWEILIGNKDEAAELFTAISDGFSSVMGPMADYRNEALQMWKDQGGRTAVLNGLRNILQSIGNILGPIYNAFKKIIDPWNGERLVSLSKGFESITEKLKITDKTAGYIQKTFEGLFSIFKLVGLILKPIGSLFAGLTGTGTPLIETFFMLTSVATGWISTAVELITSSGAVEKAMSLMQMAGEAVSKTFDYVFTNGSSLLASGIDFAKTYIGEFVAIMGDWIAIGKAKVPEIIAFVKEFNEAYKPLDKAKELVVNAFKGIQNGIQSFIQFTKDAVNSIKSFFNSIVDKIKESNVEGIDLVNAGLFAAVIVIVKKVMGFIGHVLLYFKQFKVSAIDVLDTLKDTLEAYQKQIKAEMIKKIAIAVALLAASVFLLSKIDPDRLIPAVTALGVLIGGLVGALWAFNKIDPSSVKESTSTIVALIGIATALNILASAMVKLAKLDWEAILKAVTGLSAACIAVFALTKMLDGANITPKQGVALILMATSLYALAGAMAIIGNLDASTILKSLGTIAAVMTGLGLFFRSTKGIENTTQVALSLIPLTTSLLILAGALAIFGNMNIGTLTQGFIVMSIALTQFALFGKSMSGFKGSMLSVGAGILLLANAMIVLSGALAILGNMNIFTLVQGLLAMAAALGIMALSLECMPRNLPQLASGILTLSAGLVVLSVAIAILGNLDLLTIIKGLLAIAGALAVFGIAIPLMAPAIPLMGALALGLLALGAAAGVVGGGLILLSVGMTMFAGSVGASSLALVGALMAVASTIPIFAAAVALGLVSFITVLGYNAAAIQRALTQLLGALINTIITNVPLFMQAMTVLLTEVMNTIVTLAPQIAQTLVSLIQTLLDTLTNNLPRITAQVMEFLTSMITTVLNELANAIPSIGNSITNVIVAIIDTIGRNTVRVVNAMFDLVVNIINGLANAVSTKMPEVRGAIKNLIIAIIEELKNCVKDMFDVGGHVVQGLINGIKSKISDVWEAAKELGSSLLDKVKSVLGVNSPAKELITVGKWCDIGLANGLDKYSKRVTDSAGNVGSMALNGVQKAMSSVTDLFNSDIDSNPTIRPVLDLTNIQNGSKQLDSLINNNQAIKPSIFAARQVSSNINKNTQESNGISGQTTNNNSTTEINNHFNITGNDPKEIANEVSKILQRQVERRNAAWA